jgi:hypothetical protein
MKNPTSIRNVNLLYLVVFLALFVGSLALPSISLGWRVIINEIAFLTLPLILYLAIARPDLRDALRLRGVSWQIAALSLLIGLGLWRFDWWLASLINQVLDYTMPLPPEALALTLLEKVAMVVATVLLAPVVEELLFRGLLQSAYERRGPRPAIVASAFLFILIHQELSQSVALLPVALALGYVAWRTRSVIPAMLLHFGNNAQAMLVSFVQEGAPRRMGFAPSALGALLGGLIALGALWLLARLTDREEREREPPRHGWLARNWPILPVIPIYVAVIALGVLFGVRPEALALGQQVELGSAPWEEETRWTYEIRNALDEPVGEAECTLTPGPDAFVLDCSMEQSAYEADAPTGFFKEGDATQRQTVRWDRQTLGLEGAQIDAAFSEGPDQVELDARVEDGTMSVRVAGPAGQSEPFDRCYDLSGAQQTGGSPPTDDPCRVDGALLAGGGASSPLMVGEWPWRLSALPLELAYSREADFLWPYRYVEGIDDRAPARQDVFVVVRTAEQVSTPAGDFVTWRVTVAERHTVWYTVESPHHLVAYSDDMVTWQLTDVD